MSVLSYFEFSPMKYKLSFLVLSEFLEDMTRGSKLK